MNEKLSPRAWALKRFLEENQGQHRYFSIKEICDNVFLPDGTNAYTFNTDPYKHDKCIALSNDVKSINWTVNEGYKIIIKDKFGGVKICESESEFNEWKERELKPLVRKFQYLNNLSWKAERDGTMPIINLANNPVENPHFVDVFTDKECGKEEK